MLATLRKIVPNLHYACTVLLAILAVPLIRHLHLPAHLDWRGNLVFYWVALGSRSLLYAMVFCGLAFPLRQSVGLFLARYRREKLRILFALVFLVLLYRVLPFTTTILSAAKALFVIELAERSKSQAGSFPRKAIAVFVPAAYMFAGLTLVIIYNDIIVAGRFPLSYDAFLSRVDASILWGRSISSIAHAMCAILPVRLLTFLDFAYFQMFAVVGAGLLMSAYCSYRRGMQFVGACLTAYYLALLIFLRLAHVWSLCFLRYTCGTIPRLSHGVSFSDVGNAKSPNRIAAQEPVPCERVLHFLPRFARRIAGDRDVVHAALAYCFLASSRLQLHCGLRDCDLGMALRDRFVWRGCCGSTRSGDCGLGR